MEKPKNSVDIVVVNDNEVNVYWTYQTFYKPGEEDRVSCFIPAFDIYFQAKSMADVEAKSHVITTMFFDYYVLDAGKNTLKVLALKLHSLGFKAPNDMLVMKDFANKKVIPAKFSSDKLSSNGFSHANFISGKAEKRLAVE